MRMPGYCVRCRRIKQVQVKTWIPGRAQMGTCADCERKDKA